MTELAKTFDPAAIEARWYAHWEREGLFRPDRPGAEPWTIVNPPPNVTGSLHIGHALDNTLQDILTRHARLKGKDALWVVGTDHAGIATQMVVERQLNAAGQKRTDFTREQFVERIWQWKEESGGEITRQLRRLGCSMDWANERFTMDEGFSKAVLKVFVDLYNTVKTDGTRLLYRDKRLVNWDAGLGTAISDLEVETREVKGQFWKLRYPLVNGSGFIEVATTRPETMLADMAVAVHPEDERYTALVGRNVRLPITGRLIPIVADEHADPALGSGAVKITPGHDFNDFEVGRRAGIEARDMLNMLDKNARVVQVSDGLIPADLLGLSTAEARKAVVARLKAEGSLVPHVDKEGVEHDAEPRTIQTPYGDRSGVVIEPWLTDQWYVDAKTLAAPAIEAVKSGAIRIVPKTWEKTFFNWMENIQPWCVSRQLWWGHRIPAWFGPKKDGDLIEGDWSDLSKNKIFVCIDENQLSNDAREYYGSSTKLVLASTWNDWTGRIQENMARSLRGEMSDEVVLLRDEDVLDTWFSSALWPFATLGWPDPLSPSGERVAEPKARSGEGQSDVPRADTAPLPSADFVGSLPLPASGERETLHGRYPNDVLISGFDILFFWNARMMMQGIHFMKDVPFRTLYLHGLVRAADGAKMSKSKGNTVDPLGLIDKYGADALRFFMAAMESQGRDIKMDEKRVEGYRNFATKLWNAARFCQANGIGGSATLDPPVATLAVNQWIVGECVKAIQAVDLALADYRFDAAASAIYQFVWSQFCDWYLELIKPVMFPELQPDGLTYITDESQRSETRKVAGWVLDQILVVLHPFMPFITEELWHALAKREHDLIVAHWPMADARAIDPAAAAEVEWLIRLISIVRTGRMDVNVPPGTQLPLHVREVDATVRRRLERYSSTLTRIARVTPTDGPIAPGGAVNIVSDGNYAIPLAGAIDVAAERVRLTKAIAAIEKERGPIAAKLSNPSFVERAKPEAVEKARADHADKAAEAERLKAALDRLG